MPTKNSYRMALMIGLLLPALSAAGAETEISLGIIKNFFGKTAATGAPCLVS